MEEWRGDDKHPFASIMVKAYAVANVLLPLRDYSKGMVISDMFEPRSTKPQDNGGDAKLYCWITEAKHSDGLRND